MKSSTQSLAAPAGCHAFPETRTTQLLEAQEGNDRARDELARAYWQPLYFFALRSFHLGHHQAQDLVQEFFVTKFWNCIATKRDKSKGRLRTFLLSSFKYAFYDSWRKDRTLKRGSGADMLPLMEELQSTTSGAADEQFDMDFDRDWALNLWERATEALFQEWQHKGRKPVVEYMGEGSQENSSADRFNILVAHGVLVRDPSKVREPDYPALALSLGESESTTRQIVSRARKDFRRLFREEIRQTIADQDHFDGEVEYVMNIIVAGQQTKSLS